MPEQAENKIYFAEISGNKIAYRRQGSGEPVLLIHGITTYSFLWQEIIRLLMDQFDAIAPDLIGCGESDKPLDCSYSLKNHAVQLTAFCEKLGLSRYHLVGHDLGGGIAQRMVVSYPERIISLSLLNTVAFDFWPVQPIIAMRTPIIRQLAMASLDFGTFKFIIRRALLHKEKLTPELMETFWKPMKSREGRKAFLHFARCLDNHDLLEISEQLRQLKLPVLIIRGDGDVYLSPEISRRLHSEIPGSRLEKISTAGHFVQIDEPQITADLLKKHFCS